jgi:quercetin dioxygenase-like cupin family protein
MIVKKLIHIEKMATANNVDVRNLYEADEALINVITLQAGEALKPHITPENVIFYVLKGTGIIEIGEEKQEASVDTVIESPKNIKHCWYNESSEMVQVMVIKVPKPTSKSIFV